MTRRALLGLLGASLLAAACGSVHRPLESTPTPAPGSALVRGHLSWPDCSGPTCPSLGDVPVHFADAAANRTFTAISDGSGAYAIQVPPGSYVVIAGHADRSDYARSLVVRAGDTVALDLKISPPTGARQSAGVG